MSRFGRDSSAVNTMAQDWHSFWPTPTFSGRLIIVPAVGVRILDVPPAFDVTTAPLEVRDDSPNIYIEYNNLLRNFELFLVVLPNVFYQIDSYFSSRISSLKEQQ